jgi:hypothetical protein
MLGAEYLLAKDPTRLPYTELLLPAAVGSYGRTQTPLVVSRPDLPATLQVGLFQCTYTADAGYAAFDDFSITGN